MSKPLVEDCLELDANKLKRLGYLTMGARRVAKLAWEGGFWCWCEHDGSYSLLLRFPDGRSQRLMVVKRPLPLGGGRWFFDLGTKRAVKLYLPAWGDVFRSRQAYGLEYRCTRLGTHRRLEQRASRMRDRLKGGAVRPRGMWRSTWEREQGKLEQVERRAKQAKRERSMTPRAVYMRAYRARKGRLRRASPLMPGAAG
jgi:hypothetical protein